MIISFFGFYHYTVYFNTEINTKNNDDNAFSNKLGKEVCYCNNHIIGL